MTGRLPNPNGCRLCSIDQRGHAIQTGPDGTHTCQQPTPEQIKQRMLARRQQAAQELCSVQQQAADQVHRMRAERERLTDQLYSPDPTDQVDAYLTLQGIEDAESQPPGCGWLPGDATTECDWDPSCPVHGVKGI